VSTTYITIQLIDTLLSVRQKQEKDGENFIELDECKRIQRMESIQVSTMKDAAKRLQSLVNSLKLPPTEPVLFCLQSNRLTAQLLKVYKLLNLKKKHLMKGFSFTPCLSIGLCSCK
jgi:hypothetical protein